MLIAVLCSTDARAWNHLDYAHTAPLTLELTTADAAGAPPGAVQDAFRAAVERWTDDACLETLDVSVVDTDDDLADSGDGRSTVGVDLSSGYDAITYVRAGGLAFTRFGESYQTVTEVDVAFGPTSWATDDQVAAGSCPGPGLSWKATEMVGFALGLDRADPGADSVFGQPDCSLPVLTADDRAGLRALYGSGVSADCTGSGGTRALFGVEQVPLAGCAVEPFGPSPVLDQWIEGPQGERIEVGGVATFAGPGRYALQACAEVDAPAGCDEPVFCTPWPDEYLVCAEPVPALDAVVTDGELALRDLTAVDDPDCAAFLPARWDVVDASGAAVAHADGEEAAVTLPEPGVYQVTMTLGVDPVAYAGSATVIWDPSAGTTAASPAASDPGCGCATTGSGSVWSLALLVGAVVGRRQRRA